LTGGEGRRELSPHPSILISSRAFLLIFNHDIIRGSHIGQGHAKRTFITCDGYDWLSNLPIEFELAEDCLAGASDDAITTIVIVDSCNATILGVIDDIPLVEEPLTVFGTEEHKSCLFSQSGYPIPDCMLMPFRASPILIERIFSIVRKLIEH
jgi:hypothetical protein